MAGPWVRACLQPRQPPRHATGRCALSPTLQCAATRRTGTRKVRPHRGSSWRKSMPSWPPPESGRQARAAGLPVTADLVQAALCQHSRAQLQPLHNAAPDARSLQHTLPHTCLLWAGSSRHKQVRFAGTHAPARHRDPLHQPLRGKRPLNLSKSRILQNVVVIAAQRSEVLATVCLYLMMMMPGTTLLARRSAKPQHRKHLCPGSGQSPAPR